MSSDFRLNSSLVVLRRGHQKAVKYAVLAGLMAALASCTSAAGENAGTAESRSDVSSKKATCVHGNCVDGIGNYTSPRGKHGKVEYSGEFKNGLAHGRGIQLTYINRARVESRYEGSFVEGQFHGKGTFTNVQIGSIFEGMFKNGKRTGYGKLNVTKDDMVYEGEWKDDTKHGHGKCEDESPSRSLETLNPLPCCCCLMMKNHHRLTNM